MDAIAELITAARRYAEFEGVETTTVSWRLFRDSKKLDALINGSDIQVRRHAQAMIWLSVNWPEGCDWPEGIARSPLANDSDIEPEAVDPSTLEKSGALQ